MRKMNSEKFKKIELLLSKMATEPMNRHQMAEAVNMDVKSLCKYITYLRMSKQIHIARYERSNKGSYAVYYMTGNYPDVIKPLPLTQKEYNDRYKQKTERPRKTRFIPHPDFAAAWMFNPINEKND